MTRPPVRTTHTYTDLEVSSRTVEEIKTRLLAADNGVGEYEQHYRADEGHRPGYVFGHVRLIVEETKPGTRMIDAMPPVVITAKEYANLTARSDMLSQLDALNVQAWDKYDEAVQNWRAGKIIPGYNAEPEAKGT